MNSGRRSLHRVVATVCAVAALAGVPVAAASQTQFDRPAVAPYAPTLTFGTGLVSIPVAWASPGTGDLFAAVSARAVGVGSYQPRARGSLWDLTQSLELHLGGRVSLGGSLYSTKTQQVGGFGQV